MSWMVKEWTPCATIRAKEVPNEAGIPASNKWIKVGQSSGSFLGIANDLPPKINKITTIALIIVKQIEAVNWMLKVGIVFEFLS